MARQRPSAGIGNTLWEVPDGAKNGFLTTFLNESLTKR